MQTTNFKLLLTLILLGSVSVGTAFAQSPASTDSAAILRDSVKQKVAEELAQIKQAVSKKGFVGSITVKGDASINVVTPQNQTRTVLVTNDSVIKSVANKDITVADLKIGDYVLVMGSVDSQNQMTASRLLVIGKPLSDTRQTSFGTVTESAPASFTITTVKAESMTFKVSAAVKLNDNYTLKDLQTGVKVVVLYNQTGSSLTAKRIYIFPSSVPSPTIKPSPTTRPTSTPKVSPTP